MQLSIIIINYKTPTLTKRCIESIFKFKGEIDLEIIVVDNDSKDNSKEVVLNSFPEVIWINNLTNEGFGRANNLGVSHAKGEYLLLLNSDCILLSNTLEKCLSRAISISDLGVLGCKLINEDGSPQKSIYYYIGDYIGILKNNLLYDYFFRPNPTEIKALMGAFMLIPRKVFEAAKGFDPDFFMYAEEIELCNRIKQLGYKIIYYEEAITVHKHGGSSEGSTWSVKQNYLSTALLFLKTRGLKGYFVYHILYIVTFLTNFLLLWKTDINYRNEFYISSQNYFSNLTYYIKIPFLYSKSKGNGKRILRRDKKL